MDTESELRLVRGRVMLRDNDHLLHLLTQIDIDGWEGEVATDLLNLVRTQLIRPLLVRHRLHGAVASQAEASAWAAAWDVLASTRIRTTRSPWGVVWTAARRAISTECVEAQFATSARKAWYARSEFGGVATGWRYMSPADYEVTAHGRVEVSESAPGCCDDSSHELGCGLEAIALAMAEAGWPHIQAREVLEAIATSPCITSRVRQREIAAQFHVSLVRIRRLVSLLIGQDGMEPLLLLAATHDGRPIPADDLVQVLNATGPHAPARMRQPVAA